MYSTEGIIKTTIYPIVAIVCTYLNLNQELVGILAILIIIDFITGILRAYRVGEKITSARMRSGAISKTLLIFIPFVLGLGFKAVGGDVSKILSAMVSILVVAESYSAIANITQAIKGEIIEEFDVITLVLTKILAKLKQIIENILK